MMDRSQPARIAENERELTQLDCQARPKAGAAWKRRSARAQALPGSSRALHNSNYAPAASARCRCARAAAAIFKGRRIAAIGRDRDRTDPIRVVKPVCTDFTAGAREPHLLAGRAQQVPRAALQ